MLFHLILTATLEGGILFTFYKRVINRRARLDPDFLTPKPFATSLQKNYVFNGEIFSPNSLNGHRFPVNAGILVVFMV